MNLTDLITIRDANISVSAFMVMRIIMDLQASTKSAFDGEIHAYYTVKSKNPKYQLQSLRSLLNRMKDRGELKYTHKRGYEVRLKYQRMMYPTYTQLSKFA